MIRGFMRERKKLPKAKQINSIWIDSIAPSLWGSILWLFAIFSGTRVPRIITMIMAATAILLWTIGFIIICRTAFKNCLDDFDPISYPDYKDRIEKSYLN